MLNSHFTKQSIFRKPQKAVCFLATQKGFDVLIDAVSMGYKDFLGCVVSFREQYVSTDFYKSIEVFCNEQNIPFYNWKDVKSSLYDLIKRHDITASIAIGWRYLLPLSLNEELEYPLIVFHDSLLPKYRGFAPTPTAIMCGESIVGVTAIFAADAVDCGDIIWQKQLEILPNDYIQQVIDKQSLLYREGFINILDNISRDSLSASPQNELDATYSIWRSPQDCHIDWTRSSIDIYNLIRAVSAPYPGAFSYYADKKIIINRASIQNDLPFAIRDYGKIWTIKDNSPVVICGVGMLKIDAALFEGGGKVVFNKLRVRLS